nr:MAG TPA: hypothetical protein [Caudoviricetes sp.]
MTSTKKCDMIKPQSRTGSGKPKATSQQKTETLD